MKKLHCVACLLSFEIKYLEFDSLVDIIIYVGDIAGLLWHYSQSSKGFLTYSSHGKYIVSNFKFLLLLFFSFFISFNIFLYKLMKAAFLPWDQAHILHLLVAPRHQGSHT